MNASSRFKTSSNDAFLAANLGLPLVLLATRPAPERAASLIPFPNHHPLSLNANETLKELNNEAANIQVKEITTTANLLNWDGNIVLIRPTQK